MMHKIDLSDSTSNQSPVDENASVGQNQNPQMHQSDSHSVAEGSKMHLNNLDLKPSKNSDMTKKTKKLLIIISLFAIAAGTATGYGGYKLNGKSGGGIGKSNSEPLQQVAGDSVKAGDVFGVQDSDTFKDSAEGYLEKGDADGEGSHKLLREGGDSQTVVLTSSVTDLDKLVGMEVKVWGETFKAQKAGWLMDVGRVEIVNPKGEAPLEE